MGFFDPFCGAADIGELKSDLSSLKSDVKAHTNNNDIHVTTSDKSNWNSKLDKNQGTENSGKVLGTNANGEVIPLNGYGFEYDEETKMLKYGTDPTSNLNQGIGLDDTLSKKGYAADAGAVGELKGDLDKLNEGGLVLKDEVIEEDINNWLNEHPEATTTVQNGSLESEKMHESFWEDLRIKKDYVTPEMFGAKGDGITDDTSAINKAILNGKIILFSNKTYLVSIHDGIENPAVEIPSDRIIIGNNTTIKLSNNNSAKYAIVSIYDVENVSIRGLHLVGDKYSHLDTTGEQGHGFRIYGGRNITIRDCISENCWGDGINISGTYSLDCVLSKNIHIDNLTLENNRRQGMSVEGVDGLYIDGIYIDGADGTNPQAGIDFEPSAFTDGTIIEYIDNVFVNNAVIRNTAGHSIIIDDINTSKNGNYTFNNCIVESFRVVTRADVSTIVNLDNIIFENISHPIGLDILMNKDSSYLNCGTLSTKSTYSIAVVYFEDLLVGNVNIDNLIVNSVSSPVNCSKWTTDGYSNLSIANLFTLSTTKYTLEANAGKALSSANIHLANPHTVENKAGWFRVQEFNSVYVYSGDTASAYIQMPWLFDGAEITVINRSSNQIAVQRESSNYPNIYDDSFTTKSLTLNTDSMVKLKYYNSLKAWVVIKKFGTIN